MPVVASPCINVCQMDAASGWCRGCARSLDEIAGWGGKPESVQRQVLQHLPQRSLELQRRGLWLGVGPAPVAQEQDP